MGINIPWTAERYDYSFKEYPIKDCTGEIVANGSFEEDTAFIVKAVNNHNKLVEALKDIRNFCTGTTQPEGRIDECLRVANNVLKDAEGE